MRHLAIISSFLFICACGGVSTEQADAAAGNDGGAVDAAIDAAIDADTCPDLAQPPGSTEIHSLLCAGGPVLGFNPDATPTNITLPCPTTIADPGTHGAILQPATATQADGCDASEPVSHMITVPGVSGALTQLSTTETLALNAGDRLRVRVSCPAAVVDCRGQLQITGTGGGANNLVFPEAGGFEIVAGETVVDVDVEVPAALIGVQARFNFITRTDGIGNPQLLFGNPHIAPGS